MIKIFYFHYPDFLQSGSGIQAFAEALQGFDLAGFWKEKIMELGGDYLIWSNAPENPHLN